MNIYQKYSHDIGITGISNLILAIKGMIFLPLITKTLGATGYGIMAQVMVTLALLSPIATLNLAASLARFLAAEKDRQQIRDDFLSVACATLGWSLFIALILFLLASPFAQAILDDPGLVQIVRITAIILPLASIELVCLGYFRAFREMKTYSAFIIGRDFADLALIAGFVLSGHGILGAVISLLISRALGDAVMLWIILSRIGLKLPTFPRLVPYLRFGVPLIPGLFASWVVTASDRYVIGIFLGTAAVGIYSAGYALGNIISFFSGPLAVVMLPTLSKLYDESRVELRTHLTYSLKYFLMLAIPAVFGLSMLARPLLASLSTSEFVRVGSLVTPIVALAYLLLGVYVIYSQIFILVKRTAIVGMIWVVAALIDLGLNVILVPSFGVIAAAVATLICYALVAATTVSLSRRYVEFDISWFFIAKSIAASAAISLVIWTLHPSGLSNILWVIGLSVIVYFGVLLAIRGFSMGELKHFGQLFRRS